MGNQNSTDGSGIDEHSQLMENYNIIKNIIDPNFGEGLQLQNKQTSSLCILKEFNSTDGQEFEKLYAKYKKRQELNHENIIMLIGLAKKKDSQLCSTFYKVYVLYEYVNESLEKNILFRQQTTKNYQENELWELLAQAVSGLSYLQMRGITHQNIKPSNIFVDKNMRVKIADSQIVQQLNLFSQVATNQKDPPQHSYLSPQLVEALKQNDWQPNHDTHKSDVFSLGMTIMSAGLLEDLDSCYSYSPEPIFFEDQFKQRFNQFKGIYSSKLSNFIGMMTQINEESRPDFTQLWIQLQQVQINDISTINNSLNVVSERSQYEDLVINQGFDGHQKLKNIRAQEESQNRLTDNSQQTGAINIQQKQSPSHVPKIIADDNENVIDDTEDLTDQIKRSNPQNYNKNYAEKQQNNQLVQSSAADNIISRTPAAPQKQQGASTPINNLKNSGINSNLTPITHFQPTPLPNSAQINITPNQTSKTPIQINQLPLHSNTTTTQFTNNLPTTQTTQGYQINRQYQLGQVTKPPIINSQNTSIPMNKDTQVIQSSLLNPPKASYVCKTQPDENTGHGIERGTTRQGDVQNILNQQENSVTTLNPQINNQVKQQSRSSSYHNNNNISNISNSNGKTNINLPNNNQTNNSLISNKKGSLSNLLGGVGQNQNQGMQKQNSLSNILNLQQNNVQSLNDISNIHNYSNIDDFKISNQQSTIFLNNNRPQQQSSSQQPALSTTPYKNQYLNQYDNKTKLDDFQNTTIISQQGNNNSIISQQGNMYPSILNKTDKDDQKAQKFGVGSNILSNAGVVQSTYQQASQNKNGSNNTSYNNISIYNKPISDFSQPLTQQYQIPYSSLQDKNLLTNFDELKSKLQEAEQRAKQEYESKQAYSIQNSSLNSSVNQNNQYSNYVSPYTLGQAKGLSSAVEDIMKKYENTNTNSHDTNNNNYNNNNNFNSNNNSNNNLSMHQKNNFEYQANENFNGKVERSNSQYKQAPTENSNNISITSNNYAFQAANDPLEQVKKSSLQQNNQKPPIGTNIETKTISQISTTKTNSIPSYTPLNHISSSHNNSSHLDSHSYNNINNNQYSLQDQQQQQMQYKDYINDKYQDQKEQKFGSEQEHNSNFNNQIQQQEQFQLQQQLQNQSYQQQNQQYEQQNQQYSQQNYQQYQQQPMQQAQQYNPYQQYQGQQQNDYQGNQYYQDQQENNLDYNNQFYSNSNANEIPEVVIENYSNGSRYEGEKLNGMRHGQGRFYYSDGGIYDGEWQDNKMLGRGILSYASGKIAYDGNWVDDKFHGFGALYNENPAELLECFDYRDFEYVDEYWIKYDGEFKDDNKDGFGTLYLSNDERFEGSFKNDFVCGPGSFYKRNGEKIDGIWLNNKLIQS